MGFAYGPAPATDNTDELRAQIDSLKQTAATANGLAQLTATVNGLSAALAGKTKTSIGFGEAALPVLALLAAGTVSVPLSPAMPDTNYEMGLSVIGPAIGNLSVPSVTKSQAFVSLGLSALAAVSTGSRLHVTAIESA